LPTIEKILSKLKILHDNAFDCTVCAAYYRISENEIAYLLKCTMDRQGKPISLCHISSRKLINILLDHHGYALTVTPKIVEDGEWLLVHKAPQ